MRDSYEEFFKKFNIKKEDLFEFGIKNTIFGLEDRAVAHWKELKRNIENDEKVFIRGYTNINLLKDFYKYALGKNNIMIDKGNDHPARTIFYISKHFKNSPETKKTKEDGCELLLNYQISHVFAKTKNIYAFTAPWNIAFVPKVIDPFTGYEAKGDFVNEYRKLFQRETYKKFKPLMDDYNLIVSNEEFKNKITKGLEKIKRVTEHDPKQIERFSKIIKENLSPIDYELNL